MSASAFTTLAGATSSLQSRVMTTAVLFRPVPLLRKVGVVYAVFLWFTTQPSPRPLRCRVGAAEWGRLDDLCRVLEGAVARGLACDAPDVVRALQASGGLQRCAYSGPVGYASVARAARVYNFGDVAPAADAAFPTRSPWLHAVLPHHDHAAGSTVTAGDTSSEDGDDAEHGTAAGGGSSSSLPASSRESAVVPRGRRTRRPPLPQFPRDTPSQQLSRRLGALSLASGVDAPQAVADLISQLLAQAATVGVTLSRSVAGQAWLRHTPVPTETILASDPAVSLSAFLPPPPKFSAVGLVGSKRSRRSAVGGKSALGTTFTTSPLDATHAANLATLTLQSLLAGSRDRIGTDLGAEGSGSSAGDEQGDAVASAADYRDSRRTRVEPLTALGSVTLTRPAVALLDAGSLAARRGVARSALLAGDLAIAHGDSNRTTAEAELDGGEEGCGGGDHACVPSAAAAESTGRLQRVGTAPPFCTTLPPVSGRDWSGVLKQRAPWL